MRKLKLLAAMLAMAGVMVVSTVSPAVADHWDWYDDEWGVCGWDLTPLWPYWEYGCHDPGLFWGPSVESFWGPSSFGFDAWADDDWDDEDWDDDWDDEDGDDECHHWDDDDCDD